MKRFKSYGGLVLSAPLFIVCWALATFVRRLPPGITAWLAAKHRRTSMSRLPDVRIPKDRNIPAYMLRWWRVRLKWFGSIYDHLILRSDDDRALHDHPWWSFSIVVEGGYFERVIHAGGIHERRWCPPGTMTFRWTGRKAHRLELSKEGPFEGTSYLSYEHPARTIFITGPVTRQWGFHDPHRGWVHSRRWEAHCAEHGIMPGSSTFN